MRSRAHVLLLVAGLAAMAGCGSTPGSDRVSGTPADGRSTTRGETPAAGPMDLVGFWTVDSDLHAGGGTVKLGTDLVLWADCGTWFGSWTAGHGGSVLLDIHGSDGDCSPTEPPAWTLRTVSFRAADDGLTMLDTAGEAVARLSPTTADQVPADDAYRTELPSAAELEDRFAEPAPLPDGLAAPGVNELTGRWVNRDDGIQRPERPGLDLRTDGSYTASDGCNTTAGRWAAGPEGLFLATTGFSTEIGCDNVPVAHWVGSAARLGLDGDVLVLLDKGGAELGRLIRG